MSRGHTKAQSLDRGLTTWGKGHLLKDSFPPWTASLPEAYRSLKVSEVMSYPWDSLGPCQMFHLPSPHPTAETRDWSQQRKYFGP